MIPFIFPIPHSYPHYFLNASCISFFLDPSDFPCHIILHVLYTFPTISAPPRWLANMKLTLYTHALHETQKHTMHAHSGRNGTILNLIHKTRTRNNKNKIEAVFSQDTVTERVKPASTHRHGIRLQMAESGHEDEHANLLGDDGLRAGGQVLKLGYKNLP